MGELGVQQADGVAPGAESARPVLHTSLPRYLGYFVLGNKIANLAQNVKPTTCWFDCFFVFHPCRVAGSKRQANTFFIFCGMAVIFFLLFDCVFQSFLFFCCPLVSSSRAERQLR